MAMIRRVTGKAPWAPMCTSAPLIVVASPSVAKAIMQSISSQVPTISLSRLRQLLRMAGAVQKTPSLVPLSSVASKWSLYMA